MSHNYKLLPGEVADTAAKRPRCTVAIAERYRRKEGTPGYAENATAWGPTDRRALIASVVTRLFGSRGQDTPAALGCEAYLRDALFRWLCATCRSPDSWTSYATRMWQWVSYTDRRALSAQTDTSARVVADWLYALESQGRAPRTIVTYRETVRSWFSWLFERDLIHRSPVTRDVRRLHRIDRGSVRKANGRRQVLTTAESRRVATWALSAASPEAGLSVILQMTGALRSQEVAQLERRHLVERDGLVTLTIPGKGQKTRCVRLEPIAVRAWHRYVTVRRRQGTRGPLLVAPGGGHYNRRAVQRWAKEAAQVIGRPLDISSHDLRKTAATELLNNGARLDQVQDLLGHASSETTKDCYVVDQQPLTVTTGIETEIKP